jgi:hypothetical protein
MTFTRGQLGLSDQEMDSLTSALANQEHPDTISDEIAVQTAVPVVSLLKADILARECFPHRGTSGSWCRTAISGGG